MADIDWKAIQAEYVTTNTSYRKLAAKYSIPLSTIRDRATNGKWTELRAQSRLKVVTKSIEKAEAKEIDCKTILYDLALSMARKLTDFVDTHTVLEMAVLQIKPRDITGAIKDLQDSLHIKSERDLREQEARIKKLQKDAETEDAAAREIKVTIAGALEEYSE